MFSRSPRGEEPRVIAATQFQFAVSDFAPLAVGFFGLTWAVTVNTAIGWHWKV